MNLDDLVGSPLQNEEQSMSIRGIRGATTVSEDKPELILEATRELLEAILNANASMKPEDVGSALFTVTEDLCSTFPGSLPKVIRVLVHWNTEMRQNEITHVYLRDAVKLRPDLVAAQ
jgi:chorismate mutase